LSRRRDFAHRNEYVAFVEQIVDKIVRTRTRADLFAEEVAALNPLPEARLSSCLKVPCRWTAAA
jgi:hypothetical protein